jgi:hypothetical protein
MCRSVHFWPARSSPPRESRRTASFDPLQPGLRGCALRHRRLRHAAHQPHPARPAVCSRTVSTFGGVARENDLGRHGRQPTSAMHVAHLPPARAIEVHLTALAGRLIGICPRAPARQHVPHSVRAPRRRWCSPRRVSTPPPSRTTTCSVPSVPRRSENESVFWRSLRRRRGPPAREPRAASVVHARHAGSARDGVGRGRRLPRDTRRGHGHTGPLREQFVQ